MRGKGGAAFWILGGLPVLSAFGTSVSATAQDQPDKTTSDREIVVFGIRAEDSGLSGMLAESQIDANGIAAYGLDTVGDLLGEVVLRFNATDDGPVILINGQPTTGIEEVADLPTEVVTKIQLLPREAAGALGQRPTRRVVNIMIKPNHQQVTLLGTGEGATAGGAFGAEAEANLLRLNNGNRRSLVLRAKQSNALFENERFISRDEAALPFDRAGNIVPYPTSAAEIDPALSLLAGGSVVVAAVPQSGMYTLADFSAGANSPNMSDNGRFRTLQPRRDVISANATMTQKYGASTSLSINAVAEHTVTSGLNGLSEALLIVPQSSPFSPFSNDVGLARLLGDALGQRQKSDSLILAAVLNKQMGKWRLSFSSNLTHRHSETKTDRSLDLSLANDAIADGLLNPFDRYPVPLFGLQEPERATMQNNSLSNQLSIYGSPFTLPTGAVSAALKFEWRANRSRSSTVGQNKTLFSRLNRDDSSVRLALQIPVLGSVRSSAIGSVGLELSGAVRRVTKSKTLSEFSYGLNWQPVPAISLRASINRDDIAPPPNVLTDAVLVTDGVRVYDFILGESALVTYVTGGNPDIGVETRKTTTVSASVQPFSKSSLSLTAEYLQVRSTNVFASLPPVNAEVQAAFPDRYVRDLTGRLIRVDGRIVPYSRVNRDQIRWGFIWNETFGSAERRKSGGDPDLVAGTRVNAFASHVWTLASSRLARPGLALVNLLEGGAVGYSGGVPRHTLEFGGGISKDGFGAQFDGTWIAQTRISSGSASDPGYVRFKSFGRIDLRLFANLGPQFPASSLARGARISIETNNVFNAKQKVVDESGVTPFRYQPNLLDPVGRTLRLSLRKAF